MSGPINRPVIDPNTGETVTAATIARGWAMERRPYPRAPRGVPAPEGRGQVSQTTWKRRKRSGLETGADGVQRTERVKRVKGRTRAREKLSDVVHLETEPVTRLVEVTAWDERHTKRVKIAEKLRRAGWYVRRHWAREGEKYAYTEGCPVAGMDVVDPWELFEELEGCCHDYVIRPTTGGTHGGVSVAARRCKKGKLCPVCASEDARIRAETIVALLDHPDRPRDGAVLHLVLTHRDAAPGDETCVQAWDRWEGAYQRLRTGRHGEWLRETVYAWSFGLETTNGATGLTWHPHAHGIVVLRPGVDVDRWRDELARRWRTCTTAAAITAGLVSLGELVELERADGPYRGSIRRARERAELLFGWDRFSGTKDGRERWCEAVGGSEEEISSAAYQSAKYASPALELESPARIAEWITWSTGRRLVRWGGAWDDDAIREWARETLRVKGEARHLERVALGDAPDVGLAIRGGSRPVTGIELSIKRSKHETRFEWPDLGEERTVAGVDDLRSWWALYAEHRRWLHTLRRELEGGDEARAISFGALRDALRACRKREVETARELWSRIRALCVETSAYDALPAILHVLDEGSC